MNNTIGCHVPNCNILKPHWHCTFNGCDHIFVERYVHDEGCYGDVDYDGRECCTGSNEVLYHSHCSVEGCKITTIHTHCNMRENCTLTRPHAHCSDNTCNWTYDYFYQGLVHCHFPGCSIVYQHIHCQIENCQEINFHSHCDICNKTVNLNQFHQHCTHKSKESECDITGEHNHCEHCEMTVLKGIIHSLCECGECVTNYDHSHCYTCGQRVDINSNHAHCMYCDKLTLHFHCRYVSTIGCLIEEKHQHCSKCKRVKEKGKKHICTKII